MDLMVGSLKKTNKIYKTVAMLTKKKRKKQKAQNIKIRNADITINLREVEKIRILSMILDQQIR